MPVGGAVRASSRGGKTATDTVSCKGGPEEDCVRAFTRPTDSRRLILVLIRALVLSVTRGCSYVLGQSECVHSQRAYTFMGSRPILYLYSSIINVSIARHINKPPHHDQNRH